MDIKKLGMIINDVNDNIYESELTSDKLTARLNDYQNADGKIDHSSVIAFTLQESRDYTTLFIHDLLIRLSDEGYLNN